MTTRQIGTSTDLGINSQGRTLHEEITHQLGEHAGEHDIDAIEADYRDAIAAVLPSGVWLSGDVVYGCTEDTGDDLDLLADLRDAVCDGVDFWVVVNRHAYQGVQATVTAQGPFAARFDDINNTSDGIHSWDEITVLDCEGTEVETIRIESSEEEDPYDDALRAAGYDLDQVAWIEGGV